MLCDTVPINASHLLLGRPWKYDRSDMHDGFKNTNSFTNDAKNNMLAPLCPHQVREDQLAMGKI